MKESNGMNNYEAMFILQPNLSEEDRKILFKQLAEAVSKAKGEVAQAAVWEEKRKLYCAIKKHNEGLYYLMNFTLPPEGIQEITRGYKLNENILRVLISRVES
ncbi:MAG: 30S ribosomal protein S6 [Candidatus Omnitrophica bacterium]|nr:30S ribosomal protein S6 [Candidatus Omnitrophota bacterium]